jgi:phosphoribosylpyrophosphate synthetase|tara:strand:- start:1957 stop:3192 length:1236 start_codon:yes stop_codon:yes gene_type:complete
MSEILLFPVRPNDSFASRLAESLKELEAYGDGDLNDKLINRKFSDGEYNPVITEDNTDEPNKRRCEDKDVYLVWSITSQITPTESFGRVLLLADAAYREGADNVYLVLPYYYFNRQDIDPALRYTKEFDSGNIEDIKLKKKLGKMEGQPFSLEVVVKHLHSAGIKKVLTMDDHSEHTREIYERIYGRDDAYVNLDPLPVYAHYILNSLSRDVDLGDKGSNVILFGPDKGSMDKIVKVYDLLDLECATKLLFDKNRLKENDPNEIESVLKECDGDLSNLSNKVVLGFDDQGDSLGTFTNPFINLFRKEKPKYIFGCISHLILPNSEAFTRVYKNRLNLIGTNSHPNIAYHAELGVSQITVLDITKYFALAMIMCGKKGKDPSLALRYSKENLDGVGFLYSPLKKANLISYSK